MEVSEEKLQTVAAILDDAAVFRRSSIERFEQICFKYDIKGSAKKELYAFMSTHFVCIDDLVAIFAKIK